MGSTTPTSIYNYRVSTMKTNSPARRRLRSPYLATLVMCTMVCSFLSPVLVRSQSQGPVDVKGKTQKVVVLPNSTVDAGEIQFQPDPNHQGDPNSQSALPTPLPSPPATPTP